MALKNTYVKSDERFIGELKLPNAYYRIEHISASKKSATCTVSVNSVNGDTAIETKYYSFVPSMNDQNFIAQAYNHLKTLPEFAGAVDC